MLEGFLLSGGIGAFVKHILPWKGMNRFIPILNIAAVSAYLWHQTGDPVTSIVNGAIIAMGAKGTHSAVKESQLGKKFEVKFEKSL